MHRTATAYTSGTSQREWMFESASACAILAKQKEQSRKRRWENPIGAVLAANGVTGPEKQYFRCGPFWGSLSVPEKHVRLIVRHVLGYFTEDMLRDQVVPFIAREAVIPLRLIQWLVVNYVKERPVSYFLQKQAGCAPQIEVTPAPETTTSPVVGSIVGGAGVTLVNIQQSYDALMLVHHRRCFDAFKRKYRIHFAVDGETYKTTAGQLLFLKWAYEFGVTEYTRRHRVEIQAHRDYNMALKRRERALEAERGIKHRRSECVKSRPKFVGLVHVPLTHEDPATVVRT